MDNQQAQAQMKECPGQFNVAVARALMKKLDEDLKLSDRERSVMNFVINNMVRNMAFNYCKCDWCKNLEIKFDAGQE